MKLVADPQKPDPNVFWCMECSGHTDYSETKESVSTEQGSYDAVTLKCKACDTEGEIPKQVRESIRLYAKCLIGLVIVFEAIAVGFGIYEGFNTGVLVGIYSTPFICLFLWTFMQDQVVFWRKWKKWAKERGWEEEKTTSPPP